MVHGGIAQAKNRIDRATGGAGTDDALAQLLDIEVRMLLRVRACARLCVRLCVCVCVRVRVHGHFLFFFDAYNTVSCCVILQVDTLHFVHTYEGTNRPPPKLPLTALLQFLQQKQIPITNGKLLLKTGVDVSRLAGKPVEK